MKTASYLTIVFFVFICSVSAGEYNFETTAEGIENALIKPKPAEKIRTRGIKTRGFKKLQTRGIRVLEEDKGKILEKTIVVTENQALQGVNLKIEFDPAAYTVRPESPPLLDELGKALTGEKLHATKIYIKGHTDSDGDAHYNRKLSLNRGMAVKQYLVTKFSIAPARLRVVGFGESMPLVPNNSAANKQLNRRVEIEIDALP